MDPMRNIAIATAGLIGLACPALGQTPTVATPPSDIFSMRQGRPTVSLADGGFTIQPLLRLDWDFGGYWGQTAYPGGRPPEFLDSNRPGVPDHGINLRRGRLGLQGTYLRNFTYNFTWEFAPGPGKQFDLEKNSRIFELQTAWNGLGWGTVRVGAFTLLHTIEFSTSSFETLMLERPAIIILATSLASGDTREAVGLEARGERWFAAGYGTAGVLGVLHDGNQRGLVGRAAGMAVDAPDGKLLLGFNAAAQFHPGNTGAAESVRLRDYPELRLEPTRLLDSGTINAGSAYAYGPEVSGMIGPVHFAGEYQRIEVDANQGAPNRSFEGYYATVALPLVGGVRRYNKERAVFTRPSAPDLNPPGNTWGYAELVARYSYASLNDGKVRGGHQEIFSAALTYYPLSRLRFTLQYNNGRITLDGPNRDFQAVAGRIAFNW